MIIQLIDIENLLPNPFTETPAKLAAPHLESGRRCSSAENRITSSLKGYLRNAGERRQCVRIFREEDMRTCYETDTSPVTLATHSHTGSEWRRDARNSSRTPRAASGQDSLFPRFVSWGDGLLPCRSSCPSTPAGLGHQHHRADEQGEEATVGKEARDT